MSPDLSPTQRLSIHIDESLGYQPHSWKNYLSRLASSILFGGEFPYVSDIVQTAVTALHLTKPETRYLLAYHTMHSQDSQTRNGLTTPFSRIVARLRKSLNPNDPLAPEVGDRMFGLISASYFAIRFASNPSYNIHAPTIRDRLRKMADFETEFFAYFRESCGQTPVVDLTIPTYHVLELLHLSDPARNYLSEIFSNKHSNVVNVLSNAVQLGEAANSFRTGIDVLNPYSDEAEDTISGLLLAYLIARHLAGDQVLSRYTGYDQALKATCTRLVTDTTLFFKIVRELSSASGGN